MKKLFLQSGKLMYGSSLDDQSAVEVVNRLDFEFALGNIPQEGQLYDLPKGWTVKDEYQFYSVMEEKWIYSLDQITPETNGRRRKIARLIPVIPPLTEAQRRALIDEGAPQKGIIITDNPEEVGQIYDFNQDVTGDKEYGTELSLCETESELWNDVLLKTDDPRRNYNEDQSLIKELSENFTITRKKP